MLRYRRFTKMLQSLGRLCCILGIGVVVFGKEYTDGSFYVIRGIVRDQFVNLLCMRNDSNCTTISCERYNATCSPSGCKYCLCNNSSPTYLPDNESAHGKCTQDSAVEQNTGKVTQ